MNLALPTVLRVPFLTILSLAFCACSKPAPTTPVASTPANPAPANDAIATPPKAPFEIKPGAMDADQAVPPKPAAPMPTSNDPKDYPGLKIESIKVGDGKELVVGKKAKVRYIGTLLNGKEFDSSWKRGTEPMDFELDRVVPGFRVGLLGMKVGEQRRITIPGQFGYQEAGSPGAGIGPNETLCFDVELVDVVD